MRLRTTATVVLAGAVMVLTAGCNFISPQTTTEQYDASDGVSLDVGSLEVRNAIAFTDDGGDTASLSVTLLNTAKSSSDVNFQYEGSDGQVTKSVQVDGSSRLSLGTAGGDRQLVLTDFDKKPGALVKVFIQHGSATGKSLNVPVLDGSLGEYKTLLPSPTTGSGSGTTISGTGPDTTIGPDSSSTGEPTDGPTD